MKFLVTGGPVHAKLDAVKIVTNKFKGGLMSRLAMDLHLLDGGHHITYLTGKGMVNFNDGEIFTTPTVIAHDGFDSYRQILHDTAKNYDAIILGAAVANILPVSWQERPDTKAMSPAKADRKFPSHNYREGDEFQMTWKIAPRIINEVRQYMKPGAHLFGFKLLSGVPESELVTAAYEVLLGSKSATVFANDATNLEEIVAVGPDRSNRRFDRDRLAGEIMQLAQDTHYRTVIDGGWTYELEDLAERLVRSIIDEEHIVESPEGLKFGCVAVRMPEGFATTGRGKSELDEISFVKSVDHHDRTVHVIGQKATLNAPLLDRIFQNEEVHSVEHYHKMTIPDLPVQDWAPPGTVRDTMRDVSTSFYVINHGSYILRDDNGQRV